MNQPILLTFALSPLSRSDTPQIDGMAGAGRDCCRSIWSCPSRVTQSQLRRTVSRWFLQYPPSELCQNFPKSLKSDPAQREKVSMQGIKRNCCAFAFQAHTEGSRNLQKACSLAAAHGTQRHTQERGAYSPSCQLCTYTKLMCTSSTSLSACQTKCFYLFLICIPRWLQSAEHPQGSPSHCQCSSWKTSPG